MYLLRPPTEYIHPFKSPQVAHLMWSELLMEGSNFHHLTQHTHESITNRSAWCHRLSCKLTSTSLQNLENIPIPQWQWYNNRVGFVYNSIGNHCKTEAERERGEVGGSAINVASFLPSEGRQALCNPDGVVRARGCGGWSWRDSSYPSARERRGEERKEGEHGSPWTSEAYVGSRAPSGLWPRHIPHFPPLSPSL